MLDDGVSDRVVCDVNRRAIADRMLRTVVDAHSVTSLGVWAQLTNFSELNGMSPKMPRYSSTRFDPIAATTPR